MLATIILAITILGLMSLGVVRQFKRTKNGKSSCAGCPSAGTCNRKK